MNTIVDGLPASSYTDGSIYQAERQLIFARSWLYAAHACEIPNAGDYVAVEIAGFPLIILRNSAGEIHAFANVCKHRGAPLVTEAAGKIEAATLTCKYHGWSYNCTGEIAAVPHLDSISDCLRQQLSLTGVAVSVYRDFIFVRIAPDVVSERGEFRQEYDALISTIDSSDCDFESYSFHSKMVREGNFNWKVWIEGYQECYHCPTIHPVFNKDFKLQKYSVENRKFFSLHSCERKSLSSSGTFSGLWLWIYPNLGMPVYEPCFYTLQVMPLHACKTRLIYTFHVRRGVDEATVGNFRDFVDEITAEDISICQAVQRNLQSGFVEKTKLNSGRENGVAYFHFLVREQLQTPYADNLAKASL